MTRKSRIETALKSAFDPVSVQVLDESHQHAGHAGAQPGGETHYRIDVIAEAFRGKSRVDRHRMVNAALAPEFQSGLHALAVSARAPGEG